MDYYLKLLDDTRGDVERPAYTQETDERLRFSRPIPVEPPADAGDMREGVSFRKSMAGQRFNDQFPYGMHPEDEY